MYKARGNMKAKKIMCLLSIVFLAFANNNYAASGSVSYKLSPYTKFFTPDYKLIAIEGDEYVYQFPDKAMEIKEGDIIISTQDNGDIRKIISIRKYQDKYYFKTRQATIEEAFEYLDLSYRDFLKPAEIKNQDGIQGVRLVNSKDSSDEFNVKLDNVVLAAFDGNPNTTQDRIIVNGLMKFTSEIDFLIKSENYSLKELKFVENINKTSDFELKISSSFNLNIPIPFTKNIKLAEWTFTPITIGPVVFTPIISVVVGIKATATGHLKINTSQKISYSGGLHYLNGRWTPISRLSGKSFLGNVAFLGADANLKTYLGPQLKLNFYNVAGPYINGFGYLKLTGTLLNPKPPVIDWALRGGLEANTGVSIKIFSFFKKDFNKNLIDYGILISHGTIGREMPKSINVQDISLNDNEIKLLSPEIISNFTW